MREIKFRVWDKIDKKFVTLNIGGFRGDYSFDDYFDDTFNDPISRYVIQQYTGLKDKNDKEIYEGDILLGYDGDGGEIRGEVVFDEGEWIFAKDSNFEITKVKSRASVFHWQKMVEVIGNIFENPDVLK